MQSISADVRARYDKPPSPPVLTAAPLRLRHPAQRALSDAPRAALAIKVQLHDATLSPGHGTGSWVNIYDNETLGRAVTPVE